MNQPKFKFGDKVIIPDTMFIFIIVAIRWSDEHQMYLYYDRPSGSEIRESRIKLYQEPQKKKLYAFQKNPHEFLLSAHETLPFSYSFWTRAPEYDIEYPEASV